MSVKDIFGGLTMVAVIFVALSGCEKKPHPQTGFTRADSLTETYLALQDTMLQVWNTMIHDDNRKIKTMHHLLHELGVSNPEKREELNNYNERLEDLVSMRYDQRSMSDPGIVSEYDFASNALVTELISLAETRKEFAYNSTLQKLVDSIRAADQRVLNYREAYDGVASKFNRFLDRNRETIEEMEDDSTILKRPLFQMAAE